MKILSQAKAPLLVAVFAALFGVSLQLDQCSDPRATLYDGYLDNFIYYAQNPFQGLNGLTQGSISVWAKQLARTTYDGEPQTGRLFECKDSLVTRIDDSNIRSVVVTRNSDSNTQASKQLAFSALDADIFKNNNNQLLQWNSYALSFQGGKMRFHFNGAQVAEGSLPFSILNTNSEYCVVGNSLALQDPFNGYLRHLVFSKEGFSSGQDITSKIRSIVLPTDPNVLSYFRFDKYFKYSETYFLNVSRDFSQQNLKIVAANEPENVCYCTTNGQSVLKVNTDFTLKPLPLNVPSSGIDQSSIQLLIQILPQSFTLNNGDILIQAISNFIDISVTSDGKNFKVSIYDKAFNGKANTIYFDRALVRFHTWATYKFIVSSTSVTLFIDDVQYQSLAHGVTPTQNLQGQVYYIYSQNIMPYLLRQLTLMDARSTVIIRQNFTEAQLMNDFTKNYVIAGQMHYEDNNQMCTLDKLNPALYVAPLGCVDQREYALFNRGSSKTVMIEDLYSSKAALTIEMWIKDTKTPTDNDSQVLFENTNGKTGEVVVQFSLNSGNNSANVRELRVNTNLTGQPDMLDTIRVGKTNNAWVHVYVTSSPEAGMILGYFNWTSNAAYVSRSPSLSFQEVPDTMLTAIGSSLNGNNRFAGFIRELRIWNVTRTINEIQLYRFQTPNTMDPSLAHYFQMNVGLYQFNIPGSALGNTDLIIPNDATATLNNINWSSDKQSDMVFCPQGQYFDGQCCADIDLSVLDVTFTYDINAMVLNVGVVSSKPLNIYFRNSLFADYSLLSVGNDFDGKQFTQLQPYFKVIAQRTFSVNGFTIDPRVGSVTISARVYSIYDSYEVKMNRTFTVVCPQMYLTLNKNPVSGNQFMVSAYTDAHITIALNTLFKNMQCYNFNTKELDTVSVSSITWNHNLTTATLPQVYDVASDSLSVAQKEITIVNNTRNGVSARVQFSNNQVITPTVGLLHQSVRISNVNFPTPTFQRNILITQDFELSFAGNTLNDARFSQFTYDLICPTDIFNSVSNTLKLCKISADGVFRLKTDEIRSMPMKYGKPYNITFLVGVKDTEIIREIVGTMTFYREVPSNSLACPQIIWQQVYTFDKITDRNFEVTPDSYQYCNNTFYEVTNVVWTAKYQSTGQAVANVASRDTAFPMSVFLYRINRYVKAVPSDTYLTVQGTYTFRPVNATGPLPNGALITRNEQTTVYFRKLGLTPRFTVTGVNGQNLTDNTMQFLDSQMVLSGLPSYDIDNEQAVLSYQWSCPPEIINNTLCQALQSTGTKGTLVLDAVTRQSLEIRYNTRYTFTLMVSSANKEPAYTTVNVMFASPNKSDLGANLGTTDCENLQIIKNVNTITDSQGRLVLPFNYKNYFDKNFTYKFYLDGASGQLNCNNGKVMQQYVYIQLFDGLNSANILPILMYSYVDGQSTYKQQMSLDFLLFDQPQILNLNKENKFYQISVFMFTKRQNSRVSISRQNIFLNFQKTPLKPAFAQSLINLDYYSDLVLDVSPSINYDEPENQNLTYKWFCPLTLPACNSQGPIVKLGFMERIKELANIPNVNFNFSVEVSDASRTVLATAIVVISFAENYGTCLNPQLETQPAYLVKDIVTNNNIYYFEYEQEMGVTFAIDEANNCQNMHLATPVWKNANTTQFYTSTVNDQYSVQVNKDTIKNVQVDSPYSLTYTNTFYMGQDTERVYSSSAKINIAKRKPDIAASVKGPLIYVVERDSSVFLNGSQSTDPYGAGVTCQWDCPNILNCAQTCDLELNDLLWNRITSNSISANLDRNYLFSLTVKSKADTRSSKINYYVYLTGAYQLPLRINGIQTCQIVKLDGSTTVKLDEANVYMLQCASEEITKSITHQVNFDLQWFVTGLTSTDFTVINDLLIIKPFVLAKLKTPTLTIGTNMLQIKNSSVPASRDYSVYNVFKVDIPLARNLLTTGSLSLGKTDIKAYSDFLNLTVSKISNPLLTTVMFQLRGMQALYDFPQILVPLKPFNAEIVTAFYMNMTLPYAYDMYVDIFDVNQKYLGSYNLTSTKMTQGLYFSSEFDKEINYVTGYTLADYANDDVKGMKYYELDTNRLLQLVEMLNNKLVITDATKIPIYCQQAINWLNGTLDQVVKYDSNPKSAWEGNQQYTIMRRIVQIIYNILSLKIKQDRFLIPMIQVFLSTQPMVYYIDKSQDDFDGIRRLLNNVAVALSLNLDTSQAPEKEELFTKLNTYKNALQRASVLRAINSTQTQSTYFSENAVSYIQQVQFTNDKVTLTNLYADSESFTTPNQNELTLKKISYLNVLFDQESNATSAVTTVITANAFDSNGNQVDVDYSEDDGVYFDVKFQSNDQFLEMHRNTSFEKYDVKCVYFNYEQGQWSDEGLELYTFDNETGVVNCRSTHLSTFSVIYIERSEPELTGFYEVYDGFYGFAIVFSFVTIIALILLVVFCKARASYEKVVKNKNKNCGTIIWPVMKVYHPLVKSFFALKTTRKQIPLPLHLLSLFIYIFSIIMFTCIDVMYVGQEYFYNGPRAIYFALIYCAALTILRPFANWIKYAMFFREGTNEKEDNYIQDTVESQRLRETPQHQKVKQYSPDTIRHGFSARLEDEENNLPDKTQFEGGDKEEKKEEIVLINNKNVNKKKPTQGLDSEESSFMQSQIELEKPSMFRSNMLNKPPQSSQDDSSDSESSYQQSEIVVEGPSRMKSFMKLDDEKKTTKKNKKDSSSEESSFQQSEINMEEPSQFAAARKSGIQVKLSSQGSDSSFKQSEVSLEKPSMFNQKSKVHVVISQSSSDSSFKQSEISMEKPITHRYAQSKDYMNVKVAELVQELGPDADIDFAPDVKKIDLFKQDKIINLAGKKVDDDIVEEVKDHLETPPNTKRPMLKKDISLDDIDVDYQRNFQQSRPKMTFCRVSLILLQVLLLSAELVITFVLMRNLPPYLLLSWIYAFISIIGFYLLVWDTVMNLLFSWLFFLNHPESVTVKLFSLLLVGNPHYQARHQLSIEIKDL